MSDHFGYCKGVLEHSEDSHSTPNRCDPDLQPNGQGIVSASIMKIGNFPKLQQHSIPFLNISRTKSLFFCT
jgi:hypothetical protein